MNYTGNDMKKKILLILSLVLITIILVIFIPFIILGIKTNSINSDYEYLKQDEYYQEKIEIEGIELVTQEVSCGYASIEMISDYYGAKVTEEDLDSKNKSISTSSTKGFLKEINTSIPSKTFIKQTYLKNDLLIKEIYKSLKKGNPVVIEWAAKYKDEWTLHFSIVTGLDIRNDLVTIYNPYGYIENISIDEFISRTSFKAYKNMPLFLKFGFAFNAFGKNTIFYAE